MIFVRGIVSNANAVEGDPLPFAPEHSLTLTADYRLPMDEGCMRTYNR